MKSDIVARVFRSSKLEEDPYLFDPSVSRITVHIADEELAWISKKTNILTALPFLASVH